MFFFTWNWRLVVCFWEQKPDMNIPQIETYPCVSQLFLEGVESIASPLVMMRSPTKRNKSTQASASCDERCMGASQSGHTIRQLRLDQVTRDRFRGAAHTAPARRGAQQAPCPMRTRSPTPRPPPELKTHDVVRGAGFLRKGSPGGAGGLHVASDCIPLGSWRSGVYGEVELGGFGQKVKNAGFVWKGGGRHGGSACARLAVGVQRVVACAR